jgi:Ctr copper transporter family
MEMVGGPAPRAYSGCTERHGVSAVSRFLVPTVLGYLDVMTDNRRDSMLAIMTFNVGYFLSVLGGIFLGEIAVGRYVHMEEH